MFLPVRKNSKILDTKENFIYLLFFLFTFSYSYMVNKVLFLRQAFELEIFINLHP